MLPSGPMIKRSTNWKCYASCSYCSVLWLHLAIVFMAPDHLQHGVFVNPEVLRNVNKQPEYQEFQMSLKICNKINKKMCSKHFQTKKLTSQFHGSMDFMLGFTRSRKEGNISSWMHLRHRTCHGQKPLSRFWISEFSNDLLGTPPLLPLYLAVLISKLQALWTTFCDVPGSCHILPVLVQDHHVEPLVWIDRSLAGIKADPPSKSA